MRGYDMLTTGLDWGFGIFFATLLTRRWDIVGDFDESSIGTVVLEERSLKQAGIS